jgi:hypothetical protein
MKSEQPEWFDQWKDMSKPIYGYAKTVKQMYMKILHAMNKRHPNWMEEALGGI